MTVSGFCNLSCIFGGAVGKNCGVVLNIATENAGIYDGPTIDFTNLKHYTNNK